MQDPILKSYGRNISTLTTNNSIIKDLQANFSYKSAPTFYSYINTHNRLFVIEDVSAWNPSIRSSSAIRAGAKKEFIDPSIAVTAQGLSFEKLLMDLKTFGFIFETLCIRDLKIVIISGEMVYRRKDGIYVIPIECLGV